jgi:hypothetical protein
MNAFAAAVRVNVPTMATPSVLRTMGILAEVAATHPDTERVLLGFRLLTATERHRLPALVASVHEGNTRAVVGALYDYYTPERVAAHHGTVGETIRSC